VGIKFEPLRVWQIWWIESATPVFEAPRACTDAYFLLIGQIQIEIRRLIDFAPSKRCQSKKVGDQYCALRGDGRVFNPRT
jgi:hypothetical protein